MRTQLLRGAIATVTVATLVSCRSDQISSSASRAASLSLQGTPQSYVWQVTWSPTFGPGCGFTWNWQLADGSTVAGGFAGCAVPSSGTGTIPANATAIMVDGSISGGICGNGKTVTKSVSTSQNLSVNIRLSLPATASFFGRKVDCPPGSAAFTLST